MLCSLEEEGEVYNCSLHLDFIVLLSNYWTCRLVFPNNRKSLTVAHWVQREKMGCGELGSKHIQLK